MDLARVRLVSLLAVPLLLGALGFAVAAGEGQPEGMGVVEGRVIHQADEAEALAGAVVTLHVFSGGIPRDSRREVTGPDGRFSFQGLDADPEKTYIVTTEFGGVLYFGERAVFEKATRAERDLVVYDTTTDDSALEVIHEHMILVLRPGAVEISEVVVIGNRGNRTIVSGELPDGARGTLRLTLPENAFAFKELQGLRGVHSTKVPGGIAYDSPIVPEETQVAFRYMVPYNGPTTMARQLDYPTEAIDLLVKEAGVAVTADGLEAMPVVSLGEERYLHFRGSDLAKGGGIIVTVSALSPGLTGNALLVLMLACAVGLGVVGYVYPLVRRRDGPAAALEGREPCWVSKYRESSESQLLVREIAELDDLYYEGQIGRADYKQRRRAKKRGLVSILDH